MRPKLTKCWTSDIVRVKSQFFKNNLIELILIGIFDLFWNFEFFYFIYLLHLHKIEANCNKRCDYFYYNLTSFKHCAKLNFSALFKSLNILNSQERQLFTGSKCFKKFHFQKTKCFKNSKVKKKFANSKKLWSAFEIVQMTTWVASIWDNSILRWCILYERYLKFLFEIYIIKS